MPMMIVLQILALLFLPVSVRRPYDRCDDVCRVLGNRLGGQCQEDTKGQWHCICQPGDFDADAILPNACFSRRYINPPFSKGD